MCAPRAGCTMQHLSRLCRPHRSCQTNTARFISFSSFTLIASSTPSYYISWRPCWIQFIFSFICTIPSVCLPHKRQLIQCESIRVSFLVESRGLHKSRLLHYFTFFFLFNSRTKSYDTESIPTTQKKTKFDEKIVQQNKEKKKIEFKVGTKLNTKVLFVRQKRRRKNPKQKSKYSVSITHSTSNHNKSKNRCPDANTESRGTRKMCAHPDTSFTSTPSKMLVDRIH